MKEIKTEVIINASKAKVWKALTTFDKFHEWNPFIQSAKGQPIVGEQLTITIVPSGQKPMTFRPRVLVSDANRELKWRGGLFLRGIFDGTHSFVIEPLAKDKVKLHHYEKFSGILSGMIFAKIHTSTLAGFNAMNEALKELCENGKYKV